MDREILKVPRPVLIDASGVVPVRRERFYWLDWELLKYGDIDIIDRGEYDEVRLHWTWAPHSNWLSPNSKKVVVDEPHATFVRAIKRKVPPVRPAGLAASSSAAVARWVADDFRFPPY